MILSELTASDLTKLISLLSEEIAALGVRAKMYPGKADICKEEIKKNEKIIERLERMY